MGFSEKLKRLRKERGLSRERLARKLDISAGTVFCWEINEHNPSMKNLVKLSRVLNVPIEDFVKEIEEAEESEALKNDLG